MLDKLRRVAIVLLFVMALLTGGLYLFANFGSIADFSKRQLSSVTLAVQKIFARSEAEPHPNEQTVPKVVFAFEDEPTEPKDEAGPALQQLDSASVDSSELPYFVHEGMLGLIPAEVERVIYILGQDTWANLWLVERVGERWHTAAGPLVCRIGGDGPRQDKGRDDSSTPTGWLIPSYLYAANASVAKWPVRTIGADDVWVTDSGSGKFNTVAALSQGGFTRYAELDTGGTLDLGYNRSHAASRGAGVFLYGADSLDLPTGGAVALERSNMERVLSWLDVAKYTVVGIFRAEVAEWELYSGIPEGFMLLTDGVPGAREDARYAGDDNFLGRAIDGYQGLHVVVSVKMAEALCKAQEKLEQQGLGLLVYDSYRPQRAVDDIFRWLENDEPGNKENYYPKLDKSALAGRYLSEYSLHRRGAAVDLTICDLETGEALDMGTGFDFFSPASSYYSREVSAEQAANRKLLRDVMRECGFTAYDSEWWHFNLANAPLDSAAYDFVIPQ